MTPTTHIVKTPIWRQGVKESVYNEYFCMRLAGMVGLEVPNCFIIEGRHPLFVIERYDRKNIDKSNINQVDKATAAIVINPGHRRGKTYL